MKRLNNNLILQSRSKAGFSLIELMVSSFILLIVFFGLAIYFAQPPYLQEARLYAAMEKAVGIIDCAYTKDGLFDYYTKAEGYYSFDDSNGTFVEGVVGDDDRLFEMKLSPNVAPYYYTIYFSVTNSMNANILDEPLSQMKISLFKNNEQNSKPVKEMFVLYRFKYSY